MLANAKKRRIGFAVKTFPVVSKTAARVKELMKRRWCQDNRGRGSENGAAVTSPFVAAASKNRRCVRPALRFIRDRTRPLVRTPSDFFFFFYFILF